jgi:hypothetical protein
MRALEADIARYSSEAKLILLPARRAAGVRPTSLEHAARLTIDARLAARTTLAPQRVGRHLWLVRS